MQRARLALGVLLALAVAACRRHESTEVTVFAAASTADALQELGRAFEVDRHVRVSFAFGASSDLARQLRAGARADLFLSADVRQVDTLVAAGVVRDRDRHDLLSNELVVIVPASSTRTLASAADLRSLRRVAVADPAAVPAGVYAQAWLRRTGVWDDVNPRLIPTVDVRATLSAVATESADAGVVYRTDALVEPRVRVAYVVPAEDAPPIRYQIARITGGAGKASVDAAVAFAAFVEGSRGREVWRHLGFEPLPGL